MPEHWEGVLILGLNRSAIGTLVERTTRFTMLLHLPPMEGHGGGRRTGQHWRGTAPRRCASHHPHDHHLARAAASLADLGRGIGDGAARTAAAGAVNPDLLSAAERLQYEGYRRRHEENAAIQAMAGAGAAIREIVRRTGRSRKLVRAVLRNTEDEVFRSHTSSLAPWLVALDAAWAEGCRNGAELWRRLRAEGFDGSLRVVGEWATRRRRSERADGAIASRLPPTRSIAHAMLARRDRLTRAEATMVAAVEAGVPPLATARDLVDEFHRMVRARTPAALQDWITRAEASMLAPLAAALRRTGQPSVQH